MRKNSKDRSKVNMFDEIKFPSPTSSLTYNGPIKASALLIAEQEDVVKVWLRQSNGKEGKGFFHLPLNPEVLDRTGDMFKDIARNYKSMEQNTLDSSPSPNVEPEIEGMSEEVQSDSNTSNVGPTRYKSNSSKGSTRKKSTNQEDTNGNDG